MFAVTSQLWLVGREATIDTPLWPGKSVVFTRVSHLPELVFSLLIRIPRNVLGYIKRGYISLLDNITWMKIYWQIKKKWKVILKLTAKTCITLRRLPLVLPTSGPIPRVLGCGLTSHFGASKIPIYFNYRPV